MKLKSLCTTKERINQARRQSAEWQETFAGDTSSAGLISRTPKELNELNTKRTNNLGGALVAHTFDPSRQRQAELCESEASLVYTVSSRTAKAVGRGLCLETNKPNFKN